MKPFIFSILTCISFYSFSQKEIKWTFGFSPKTNELTYHADLQKGWHVYSTLPNEGGPVPTSFELIPNPIYSLVGEVIEPKPIEEYDPNFDMKVFYFGENVTFRQYITANQSGVISGSVVYMICNDQMCLPPEEVKFTIQISK